MITVACARLSEPIVAVHSAKVGRVIHGTSIKKAAHVPDFHLMSQEGKANLVLVGQDSAGLGFDPKTPLPPSVGKIEACSKSKGFLVNPS